MRSGHDPTRRRLLAGLATAAAIGTVGAAPAGAQPGPSDLARQLGPGVSASRHAGTGMVRFIGTAPGKPIVRPPGVTASASPRVAARAFMRGHGTAFGLRDETRELRVTAVRSRPNGRASVRFQQVHEGVPVVGGELVVNLDSKRNILSVVGEATPNLRIDTAPGVSGRRVTYAALERAAKAHRVPVRTLRADAAALSVFDPRLLDAPGPVGARLVWRTEVTSRRGDPIRELVLVDARTAKVVLHFNQIAHARNRRICDAANSSAQYPCTGPVRVEGQGPHAVVDVNQAYDFSGDTYNFLLSRLGRDSLDGRGMPLVSTVRFCDGGCPFANAFWDGHQMTYGTGFASADDVVGHEFAHGVTEFTSHLFYYHQSGAINESLSDVFGELVDLTNGRGTDTPATRWQLGEDLPASVGVLRDMENPPLHGDPDRMRSPLYKAYKDDAGGVHSNSGVNNKAASLMVDGGTFNGRTVTALGIDKVAKIYYEAEVALLTSASDYADLYNALPQACNNLVGTAGVTTANCIEVGDAVAATEMNLQPSTAPTPQAPPCPAGQYPRYAFNDTLENPAAGRWVKSGSGAWYYPQNTHPYTGFDATYATSGKYNFWGDDRDTQSNSAIAMVGSVAVPANAYLTFQHSFEFEAYSFANYDGGVVEYSANGGPWTDAGPLFTHGGYNGVLDSTNPLGARRAFVDRSFGYGASRLNLAGLAGRSVRFRFRLGTDGSVGDWGWFVDDVRIHTCSADATRPIARAPVQAFTSGGTLGTSVSGASLPVQLTWAAATDDRALPGQIRYALQRSVNGGPFASLTAWTTRRSAPTQWLAPGLRYQYRVLARDPAGNIGVAAGPGFVPGVAQENSVGMAYTGAWLPRLAQPTAFGGFVRPTVAAGATARRAFAGRSVAVVMPRAATLGTARVCLYQGAASLGCQAIDLSPATGLGPRRVVYSRSGLNPAVAHRIDVTDLAGRIELDAIAVLR